MIDINESIHAVIDKKSLYCVAIHLTLNSAWADANSRNMVWDSKNPDHRYTVCSFTIRDIFKLAITYGVQDIFGKSIK